MAKIDADKMIAEIDLNENKALMIRDGEVVELDTPGDGYGKQVITWQGGKPSHYEVSYTKK